MALVQEADVGSPKPNLPRMSCEEEVGIAEDLLVLTMFKEAAVASKTTLERLLYSPKDKQNALRKRAAFVWMQAEFATGSLEHSWQHLEQFFHDDVGADVATVWCK